MAHKSLSARAVSTSIAPSIVIPAVKPSRNSRKAHSQQGRVRITLPHSHCQVRTAKRVKKTNCAAAKLWKKAPCVGSRTSHQTERPNKPQAGHCRRTRVRCLLVSCSAANASLHRRTADEPFRDCCRRKGGGRPSCRPSFTSRPCSNCNDQRRGGYQVLRRTRRSPSNLLPKRRSGVRREQSHWRCFPRRAAAAIIANGACF
jgi:hypothetical protein